VRERGRERERNDSYAWKFDSKLCHRWLYVYVRLCNIVTGVRSFEILRTVVMLMNLTRSLTIHLNSSINKHFVRHGN